MRIENLKPEEQGYLAAGIAKLEESLKAADVTKRALKLVGAEAEFKKMRDAMFAMAEVHTAIRQ